MFSLTNYMFALLAAVGLILLWFVFLFVRNPVLIKIGLRNIPRRPAQSILIVIGLTLSTVIILASLALGDTLNYSVQRQAVDAYGAIDQVLAPPVFSLLAGIQDGDDEALAEMEEEFSQLTAGGLTTVLSILDGGLPSISEARFRELKAQAEDEPLIDGVAGSILFPTIIRDINSGQGEPLGFVFAVDDDYDEAFGLQTVDGELAELERLQPGVGNIFAQATNLFDLAGELGQRVGLENVSVSQVAGLTAAVGAAATVIGDENFDPAALEIDVATLRELGIDTTPLEEAGIETLSLETLGITPEALDEAGVTGEGGLLETIDIPGVDVDAVRQVTTDLLGSLNLNTLGRELDEVLAQFGLQLRQGDVYLNRLGAERLNARVGDVLEIYVGPVPVPYRVAGIVEQAGPTAALTPVVVMPLAEAQQLFFMSDRVNNILVSNEGDELSGLVHTDEVSRRLRVLALDETALAETTEILRRPAVRAAINSEAPEALSGFEQEFDGPAFIGNVIEDLFNLGEFGELVVELPAALDEPGANEALRLALTNTMVREWLLGLDIPRDDREALRTSIRSLNQFDVIDPLSKSSVVTVAGVGGTIFSSVFSLFGFFSVLAAILLIFLIFVMLAAERRNEMGMARAIGVQRRHLVQMFSTEGLVYDFVAAGVGVLVGLLVSYAMVGFIGGLFNDVAGQFSDYGGVFSFRFRASTPLIVIAYCIGVLFTFIVVTIASWRVSRLNIVAAIRDLPEPERVGRSSTLSLIGRTALDLLLVGGGIYAITVGVDGRFSLILVGLSLLLVGGMLLLGWLLERTSWRREQIQRLVYTVIGLGLLLIWAVPWWSVLDATGSDEIAQLASDGPWVLIRLGLTGPLIILGAILVIMFNADALTWTISRLLGGIGALTPVLKTAIAYPLSTRFRTGIAMLLFAMVISTVTLMAVVIDATQTLVTPDSERNAGFEIGTSFSLLSFFNPLDDLGAAIAANPDFPAEQVAAIGAIATAPVEAQRSDQNDEPWRFLQMVGVNQDYLDQAEATYAFALRAPGYADDAAVWEALRTRDDVAILSRDQVFATLENSTEGDDLPFFVDPEDREEFEREFQPERRLFDDFALDSETLPPVMLRLRPLPDGFDAEFEFDTAEADATAAQDVEIIGVLENPSVLADSGVQLGPAAWARVKGEPFTGDEYYLKVVEGADVGEVAQQVERTFLSSGLNAFVLAEQFAQGQALTRGILRLFQGFMALGLLVGIAALGVIMTRTVVERRQQVGVMRAIGFQPRMVAFSFLFEASFIALSGILIGTMAGVSLGRQIVLAFYTALAGDAVLPIPWLQIGGVVLLAYLFALLTTVIPAYQAARIYPAEALRYE